MIERAIAAVRWVDDRAPWRCWVQGHAWLPCLLGYPREDRR